MADIPEFLYHTTLVVYDGSRDPSNRSRSAFVLGTHTTLPAAKNFAATALQGLGYEPSDFEEYAVHNTKSSEEWTHGDGVVVYAKAYSGQEFAVGLDTTPNDQGFAAGGPDGTLHLSGISDGTNDGDQARHLHYVLQTVVDYDQFRHQDAGAGRNGVNDSFKSTEIEGCFLHRTDAIAAAKTCLKNTGYEFAQYDERNDLGYVEDWPFGEDVIVHAVSQTGENYAVAVRTIPGAHKKLSKENRKA
ncbi:hypothetical protein SEUCBS139899_008927 [Sporothrix eucalyptigena]|uniref:Uncharacterized protein n=1 Tax=Sporothrix eucalyptigena TaxID=1812306 RepID=A0ABP0CJG4_9PEZI